MTAGLSFAEVCLEPVCRSTTQMLQGGRPSVRGHSIHGTRFSRFTAVAGSGWASLEHAVMPLVTLCLRLHQPVRLSPDETTFLWSEKNREIFVQQAEGCYLPSLRLFADLVGAHPNFRVAYAVSGTFLEQAEQYQPEVIEALRSLLTAACHDRQVEFCQAQHVRRYPPSLRQQDCQYRGRHGIQGHSVRAE